MKKIKLLSLILIILSVFQIASAQVPQGMNYQAIARDAGGSVLANKNINIRITITNGNGGTELYKETHSPTTNQFGLFTLNIGYGTPVSGTFSSIKWSAITPWMQVEMDPNVGGSYISMGASQLLSVPYALHAATSDNAGMTSTTVYGTAPLTLTSGNPAALIPGLTQTIYLADSSDVLMTSTGCIQTTSTSSAGYSLVDVTFYVDGVGLVDGMRRIIAANTGGIVSMWVPWSLAQSVRLSAGTHTVMVVARHTGLGSAATASGASGSVLQGVFTVTTNKR